MVIYLKSPLEAGGIIVSPAHDQQTPLLVQFLDDHHEVGEEYEDEDEDENEDDIHLGHFQDFGVNFKHFTDFLGKLLQCLEIFRICGDCINMSIK